MVLLRIFGMKQIDFILCLVCFIIIYGAFLIFVLKTAIRVGLEEGMIAFKKHEDEQKTKESLHIKKSD